MKFRIRSLFAPALLSVMCAVPGRAQEVMPQETELDELEVADLAQTATPAMWRVTDADSEYILVGTFHVLPPSLNWRTDLLDAAFNDAAVTYFEVDANAPDATAKTLNTVMSQGFNAPGTSLAAMLETGDATKLRGIVNELKLPFVAVDTMRPWNAFLTLSVQFIINQGFDPGNGVDSVLLNEAKAGGKSIRYFESIEEQLSFFTGLAPAVEKDLLVVTIRDWDKQAGAFDELFNAWASGDTDYIDTQMNGDMREQAPEVYKRLIVERNAAWADELDAALKNESGKGLVAVGAAHLVGGEFSVPALLAAKGYEVTRYDVASVPEETIDVLPEVTPDETADVMLEVAPEIAPDAAPETAPEAANDNEPLE